MAETALHLFMYGLLPLWILAGLADWACHRRTRIEATTGLRENLFHWAQFLQVGVAVLALLLLEINLAALSLLAVLFLTHELTTWIELRMVAGRREISPVEQMVHSFMEILPLAAWFLLAAAYFGEARPGADPGRWKWEWKAEPLPVAYLVGVFVAVLALNVLPLAQEAWRCRASVRESH